MEMIPDACEPRFVKDVVALRAQIKTFLVHGGRDCFCFLLDNALMYRFILFLQQLVVILVLYSFSKFAGILLQKAIGLHSGETLVLSLSDVEAPGIWPSVHPPKPDKKDINRTMTSICILYFDGVDREIWNSTMQMVL